ncbi:MAG: hypothetical protein ACR2N8_01200 [Parvibaculales bacterium]
MALDFYYDSCNEWYEAYDCTTDLRFIVGSGARVEKGDFKRVLFVATGDDNQDEKGKAACERFYADYVKEYKITEPPKPLAML